MTWSSHHVLMCDGRLAPLWEPCPEVCRGEQDQQMDSVWTDAGQKGWTRVKGTYQTLCCECAKDVHTAMTLGPCAECGRLRLFQRAYTKNPELRRDRVRDNGMGLCQACYMAARRGKSVAALAMPVHLPDAEVLRLRRMVGIVPEGAR